MSYQDELQRLVEAKASMRQSIIDKGVDVPDDAKIEEYAGYILQIEGGGQMPSDDGTEWGTVYSTTYPDGLVLADEASFKALCDNGKYTAGLRFNGSVTIRKDAITKVSLGKNCTEVGDNFLLNCINAKELLYSGKLEKIGKQFLNACSSLNCEIELSENLKSIDFYFFMYGLRDMTGPIIINTPVTPTSADNYVLTASTTTAPFLTVGCVIKGKNAQAWRDVLPDTNNRKLILE